MEERGTEGTTEAAKKEKIVAYCWIMHSAQADPSKPRMGI